jgi:phage protein D/phage baseplate assembly protein gpV
VVAVKDPERKFTLAQFRLQINGANPPPALVQAISKIVVDERLHAPTMVEVHLFLEPSNPRWVDDATIAEGKELEVFVGPSSSELSICVAKVTAIEVELDDQMPMAIIRGFDLSFALHRDVKSRSFLDQTDSDIATKIAGEAPGLSPKVDSTTEVHPYVFQHAQSNYEFLRDRARRIGYELRVSGRDLNFKKPEPAGSPVTLNWGSTLKRFSPRLSVAEQVDKVEVRGWDALKKEVIVSTADNGNGVPKVGETRKGNELAKETWGTASHVIPHAPVINANEATSVAQAVLDDLASSYIQAIGEASGDPRIRVGTTVKVEGAGKRFSGDYYLTAVRHTIDKASGHLVTFSASTREPDALATVLQKFDSEPKAPHVYVGIVTNIDDPEKLGRVKVKLPALFAEDESYWARLLTPMAGAERGFLTIPEVNDEVLIAFENGDPTRPYVLGGLWSQVDPLPKGTADIHDGNVVNQRLWRSRTGHLFIFDDTDGKESIQIIDKTEKNHIIITSSDNKLDIVLDGDIEVTSKTGKISVKAEKDITIESSNGKVALKGVTTEFEAKQSAKMKSGTNFDVESGTSFAAKAGTSAEVNGTASVKIAGATVDVQGQAATNIKGGVVNIN